MDRWIWKSNDSLNSSSLYSLKGIVSEEYFAYESDYTGYVCVQLMKTNQ